MGEFDHHAIAPMMDCASGSEYYRRAASGNHLHNIACPTLFIHAVRLGHRTTL